MCGRSAVAYQTVGRSDRPSVVQKQKSTTSARLTVSEPDDALFLLRHSPSQCTTCLSECTRLCVVDERARRPRLFAWSACTAPVQFALIGTRAAVCFVRLVFRDRRGHTAHPKRAVYCSLQHVVPTLSRCHSYSPIDFFQNQPCSPKFGLAEESISIQKTWCRERIFITWHDVRSPNFCNFLCSSRLFRCLETDCAVNICRSRRLVGTISSPHTRKMPHQQTCD